MTFCYKRRDGDTFIWKGTMSDVSQCVSGQMEKDNETFTRNEKLCILDYLMYNLSNITILNMSWKTDNLDLALYKDEYDESPNPDFCNF